MTSAAQNDSVRTKVIAASLFDDRSVPAGAEEVVPIWGRYGWDLWATGR